MGDRVVVVTGAGGPAGRAVTERLVAAGDTVIAVDARPQREIPGARHLTADLLHAHAVSDLARRVASEHDRVDGVVHLVGGWRGAASFLDTDLADWDLLHDLLIRTLQHVSLAFTPLLEKSGNGRFVIVSARAAAGPGQGDAAYAAAKAAAEAWTLALADALRGTPNAAVILVVRALVHDAMRAERPRASFAGHTDVRDLARAVAELWDRPAGELNGTRVDLAK